MRKCDLCKTESSETLNVGRAGSHYSRPVCPDCIQTMAQCLYIAGIDFMINLDTKVIAIHGITGADKKPLGECGIEARQVRRRIAELTVADLAEGAVAFVEATSISVETFQRGLEAYDKEMSIDAKAYRHRLEISWG